VLRLQTLLLQDSSRGISVVVYGVFSPQVKTFSIRLQMEYSNIFLKKPTKHLNMTGTLHLNVDSREKKRRKSKSALKIDLYEIESRRNRKLYFF
jgi:hypothetical protein